MALLGLFEKIRAQRGLPLVSTPISRLHRFIGRIGSNKKWCGPIDAKILKIDRFWSARNSPYWYGRVACADIWSAIEPHLAQPKNARGGPLGTLVGVRPTAPLPE